jgi:hypothetical protein
MPFKSLIYDDKGEVLPSDFVISWNSLMLYFPFVFSSSLVSLFLQQVKPNTLLLAMLKSFDLICNIYFPAALSNVFTYSREMQVGEAREIDTREK